MLTRATFAAIAALIPVAALAEATTGFDTIVPQSWTEARFEDAVLLTSPGDAVRIHFSVIAASSASEAVRAGWDAFAPGRVADPVEVITAPSRPGADETWFYDYEPDAGQGAQAMVERRGKVYYVALIRGDAIETERRMAQINIALTGFEPREGTNRPDLADAEVALSPEDIETLEAFVEGALGAFDIPGAAVAVVMDGAPLLVRGFGVKERGGDAPVGASTQFMIGSTGKTMTTMLMGQLVDEGRLDWDTPVVEVLPRFALARPELTGAMTVSHLVCACTGVPRRDLEIMFNGDSLEAEDVIESLATFETFTGFGEAFQYSNQLVATGGWAAAAAAGASWGALNEGYFEAVEARLLQPIGMDDTDLRPEEVLARGNHALPHGFGLEGRRVPIGISEERVVRAVAPAGAPWSTASDMSLYLETLIAGGVAPDGTRIVSEQSLAQVWTPHVPVLATVSYGLGWYIEDWNGLELVHHGGNTMGFTSDLALLPEARLGIVVLANGGQANDFTQAVRARLLELAYDLPADESAEMLVAHGMVQAELDRFAASLQADPEAAAPFIGDYTNPALGAVRLSFVGGDLVLDIGETIMTLRREPDAETGHYVVVTGILSGEAARLVHAQDGTPELIFGEGAAEYVFRPILG